MRVLVAPDKFRGTLSAEQAARAIAAGWRRVRPDDRVVLVPMADGGEGTLDALVSAMSGEVRSLRVSGPLGDPVDAAFGLVRSEAGPTAVVELARASGLHLVAEPRRAPLRAGTRGTGELILAACREGVSGVLVCLGGSATTDGGAGIAQALGAELLDEAGDPIGPGGAGLLALARIDLRTLDRSIRGVRFVVASDVDSPLTGRQGAAHVYAPQKGASPEDVVLLDRALGHLAAVVHRDLGIDVRGIRGGGAAGGTAAGLAAFLGARIRRGIEVVMEAVGLRRRLEACDLVLTGEGAFDRQSLRGKAPAGVLEAARELGVPAAVVCGRAEIAPKGIFVASLVDRFGRDRAMGDARLALEDLAAEVARRARELSSRS